MRIVFVLCEGPHDVAFLSRLLSAAGYMNYKKTVKDYPFPLSGWLVEATKKLSIEDLNVDKVYKELSTILPSGAMVNEDCEQLILLYAMHGDSRKKERKELMTHLKKWISSPEDEKEFSIMEESSDIGHNFGLVILYDADDKGIEARIAEIKTDLRELFPIIDGINRNGEVISTDEKFKIGAYVFAEENEGLGTLEDILLPLMKKDNEDIFKDAEHFLDTHKDVSRLRPLVFMKDSTGKVVQSRNKSNKYHPIKSLLGVVGQLQNSGTSNTVCIEKSDYITLEKINNSIMCQEILEMFSKL